jgi:thiol-disulfide isomerase/thioredoxin
MTSLLRLLRSSAILIILLTVAVVAQPPAPPQTQPPTPPTPSQTPPPTPQTPSQTPQTPPAPPARTPTPEQKAYQDALAVSDPAARLEALRKFQADHPEHTLARAADSAILGVLVTTFKDREREINETIDKILSASTPGPASAPALPETQLMRLQPVVMRLVDNNVLLDRAETLLSDALGKLNRDAYVTRLREGAERSRKLAEERQKTTPLPSGARLPEIPTDATSIAAFDRMRAGAIELRGRIALARGDSARAEKDFKEAFAANASLTRAPLELAKLASARGDDRAAIDYYLPLALTGKMKRAEEEAFTALYRKVHGSGVNVEAELDRLYGEKYPNPVAHPEKYSGPRSGRVALLEMFTGSACPPCVSADLALDAAMERYPADAVAVLAYHVHIPGPDPMTVPSSDARRNLYAVPGVPTFNVDGARARLGGGSRENTENTYKAYVPVIDKALQTPPEADVKVTAAVDGSRVRVQATVGNVKSTSQNLRLHILLAEKNLNFLGENGIKFHPFVVRDAAGDKGSGLPITAAPASTTLEHTFDLAPIPDTITRSLADDIARRRKSAPADAPPREYRAEGRAMTKIDASQLVVVAFVQDMTDTASSTTAKPPAGTQPSESTAAVEVVGPPGTRPAPTFRVLQAAWTTVTPATSAQRKE